MLRLVILLLSYLFMVTLNGLANALPINGITTGEISDRLNVLFTPAGYVFSIWGLIYTLLLIWVIRRFIDSKNLPFLERTTLPFIISAFLNGIWILFWHYGYYWITLIVMVALLVTLIYMYLTLKRLNAPFIDRIPFSVYLGWISVATVANMSYVLVEYGWNGFGLSPILWTILILIIACLIALIFRFRENDRIYAFVFVWAFVGIAIKQLNAESIISAVAFALAAVIFVLSILPKTLLNKK